VVITAFQTGYIGMQIYMPIPRRRNQTITLTSVQSRYFGIVNVSLMNHSSIGIIDNDNVTHRGAANHVAMARVQRGGGYGLICEILVHSQKKTG
jgi:hypothetical protein